MFWLDRVNGDLEVRQAAALCQTKHCCTARIGIWTAAGCRTLSLYSGALLPKPSALSGIRSVRQTKFLHKKYGRKSNY